MPKPGKYHPISHVGIDIGRVIVGEDPDDYTKSLLSKNYLEAPEVKGAITAIGELCMSPFWSQVHLISKCSELVEKRTMEWLYKKRFFERTTLPVQNVHFCRTHEEKAIWANRYHLSHFVDDQSKNLHLLPEITVNRILFAPTKKPKDKDLEIMRVAQNWTEAKWLLEHPPRG